MMRTCHTLILLVGSNPLPNYLAAKLLNPRKLFLIHTPETREPAERLTEILKDQVAIKKEALTKSSEAREIAAAIARIMDAEDAKRVHLNYTGGTKVMAAHARMAFGRCGGTDENASYLNDATRRLFFDDDLAESLEDKDLGLTLNLVGQLHGCEMMLPSASVNEGPTEGDAVAIAASVSRSAAVAKCLYEVATRLKEQKKPKKALENPCIPTDIGLALSARQIPEEGWDERRFEAWWRFLGGGWLESAVAAWVKVTTGILPSTGIYWRLAGREFEIDVALVRTHRLYLISCTTDDKLGLCKSKLFEIAMRSRQLGGDLARSALVCLIDGQDAKGKYIDQVRGDVESVWEAPNKPRVFGLADLREWTGIAGARNLHTLKEWLDS